MEANVTLEGTVELDTEEVWSELESNVESVVESYVDNYDFSYVVGGLVRDEMYEYDLSGNFYFEQAVHDEVGNLVTNHLDEYEDDVKDRVLSALDDTGAVEHAVSVYLDTTFDTLAERVTNEVVARLVNRMAGETTDAAYLRGWKDRGVLAREDSERNAEAQAEARREDDEDRATFLDAFGQAN